MGLEIARRLAFLAIGASLPAGAVWRARDAAPAPIAPETAAPKARARSGVQARSGRILSEDGAPVRQALVRVFGASGELERSVSDARGEFSFTAPPAAFRVIVTHPHEGSVETARLAAGAGSVAADPLVLVLGRSVGLEGSVVDTEGGAIADVELEVRVSSAGPEQPAPRWIVSNRRGRFAASGFAEGAYWLTARARGFVARSRAVELVRGGPALRIALETAPAPRGVVLDPEGRPVAGARVVVCAESRAIELTSAPDGSLEVAPDAIGCLAVAHHPAFAHSKPARLVGSRTTELRLEPGGAIEGVVSGPSGGAIDGLSIEISGFSPAEPEKALEGTLLGRRLTIAREFRFTNLAPGGYTLEVQRSWPGEEGRVATQMMGVIQVLPGEVTRGVQIVVPDGGS